SCFKEYFLAVAAKPEIRGRVASRTEAGAVDWEKTNTASGRVSIQAQGLTNLSSIGPRSCRCSASPYIRNCTGPDLLLLAQQFSLFVRRVCGASSRFGGRVG